MLVKRGRGVGATVQTAELDNLSVTAAKLATDAVETAKIKDLNVTTAKLNNLAVTEAKLAADAVTKDKINATGDGALKFLRIAANATDLEFSTGGASAADNITMEGNTMTLGEWLLL